MTIFDLRLSGSPGSIVRVFVRFAAKTWMLADGESVSVGREPDCDIRIGFLAPDRDDRGVSRRAATIVVAGGMVWVRNDSSSQPVYLHLSRGEEIVLARRFETFSTREARFEVALEGRLCVYQLDVERDAEDAAPLDEDDELGPTTADLPLTDADRRLLVAICRPLLTKSGRRRKPASYKEAAESLSCSPHHLRNRIDELRGRLVGVGVRRLVGPDAKDALAHYAVRTGAITAADLEPGS